MKFLIVTNAPTLKKNKKFYSYSPYVKEMNIWSKYISEVGIVSPNYYKKELLVSSFNTNPTLFIIPSISFIGAIETLKSLCLLPYIIFKIYKTMLWADHIHLRCPGNIGLLGCFVQIFFSKKPKTVKYAGNWDPNSKQPWSYRLQKWIISNTFLTRNTKVLVYGNWANQSKNVVPFFTASYSENEIEDNRNYLLELKSIRQAQTDSSSEDCYSEPVEESHTTIIKFIFVGGLTPGKQPLLTVKTIHQLQKKGYNVQLDIYGDGVERKNIENYIQENNLQNIYLHGNSLEEIVKKGYQKAHFLVFLSKSEGWPKVVAEAMFWGCLPITTNVSCISEMLDNGNRGSIVNDNLDEIIDAIQFYIQKPKVYKQKAEAAQNWSRQFTLEKFENEIKKLVKF